MTPMPDPRLTLGMLELAAAEMVAERRAHDPEAWAAPLPALEHLDASWRLWTHDLFPRYVTHDFSAHQAQLWDWLWRLTPGTRPAPFIGIWPRGSAKSTSAELGTVALGCRGTRHYGLYVCHEVGTMIFDVDHPEAGWHPVEQHPTAQRIEREGLSVELKGLPMVSLKETVTPEHRYWARRVASRQVKHVGQDTRYGPPHWIEARHLDWNTWIGHPIDSTVLTADEYPPLTRWNGRQSVPQPWPLFQDPDFWWVIGLWWGDGTLGGARRAAISWSCSDDHLDVRERLLKLLERWGYQPRCRPNPQGERCADVTIADSVLARWLLTWRRGPNRKEPPVWVERLPTACQQELIRGYLDADGSLSRRGASLSSIHLPGLLAVRRMLARLGVVCHIGSIRTPGRQSFPGGRSYVTQRAYRLHIEHPAVLGLAETIRSHRHEHAPMFIREGYIWSRVVDVQPSGLRTFVPIQTADHTYLTAYGRSHNCSTQAQADDHVSTIGSLLESPRLARAYPDMASRLVGKYGHSQGWRRNRLRTRSRFTVDALGLDTAARGAKLEMTRPDFICFDDVDSSTDSLDTIQRKITLLSRDLLPAGSADCAVLGIQNLIHPDGLFARLIDGRAEFLQDRVISGPIPALEGLTYVLRDGRYVITGGTPTWAGQDVARCQALMDTIGLTAFRIECQHEATNQRGGMFDHLEFQHCTWDDVPPLVRIVGYVDPAVTNTDDSDAYGIHFDGISVIGTIYRLWSWEDRTSPEDALRRAITKGLELKAECCGVESDQGGDLWEVMYHEVGKSMGITPPQFRSRKAGAGYGPKVHRASQMLADYERAKIVHVVGTHEVLERALRRFPKFKPLDLVDASWHAWFELRQPSDSGVSF
jgi:hypothetical protein